MRGFPLLINRTPASEQKSKSLLVMGIKGAHLPSDIANAGPIHQAQNGAIELSQETGNWAGAGLAGVFSQRDIPAMMQNPPC